MKLLSALRLPDHLRGKLSRVYGNLLCGEPSSNVKTVLAQINSVRPPKVTIVGDFTLKAFIDAGYRPDLGIFDNKTRRDAFVTHEPPTIQVTNPPGLITNEAIIAIRQSLSSKEKIMLLVLGEEDLLSLVSILESPEDSLVIYGLPDKGMIVITVTKTIKEKMRKLLSQFPRIDWQP
ncbi:MAG: DUF359 domain-containing protein [Candidatus Methanomethylicus sp.]|nr:DUF359 domain-containing protein [Candidatus Methanomethylicus sp.]